MLVTNPETYPKFAQRLDAEHIPHLTEGEAANQDIYTINVGLANLMPAPAMKATEMQWFRWFGGDPVVQTRPHFVKFDNDRREAGSRAKILDNYTPLSELQEDPEIRQHGLDMLVITGDNLETTKDDGFASGHKPLKKEAIAYHNQLADLIKYSEEVPVTVFSCLGAHFALQELHGLERKIPDLDKKIIGVFEHAVTEPESILMRGMGDVVVAPHSRWGNISVEEVDKVRDLKVLAVSEKVGWLALEETLPNGNVRVYLQGHPEYDKFDLDQEYKRDRKTGNATMPYGYYPENDCSKSPKCNWPPYARVLHANILGLAYSIGDQRRRQAETQQPS